MAEGTATEGTAVKRSVLRVIGFDIITSGLYAFYWFYVTRQKLDSELGEKRWIKQSPAAQLFGPLALAVAGIPLSLIVIGIPLLIAAAVLGFLIVYGMYRDIALLHKEQGLGGFPAVWFVLAPVILGIIPIVNFVSGIVSLVLWGVAVGKLNEYWDKKTGGKALEAKYGSGEIAVIVIGVLFWILILALLALGVFAAIVSSVIGGDASTTVPNYNYGY
ncbi:MAG: DUF4234 domain-containing protein [Patescibacteria group bacterium]